MKIISTTKYAQLAPGPSKQSLKNKIYKIINPLTTKIYHGDTSWKPVTDIFGVFKQLGLDWTVTSADYDPPREGSQMPQSKRWKFEINFTNNKGKPDIIYGQIIASGAGSVTDPLESFDLNMLLG